MQVYVTPSDALRTISDWLSVSDIVRGIAIATDALVLVMTWLKTRSIYRAARRAKVGTGLSELLLRDGQ